MLPKSISCPGCKQYYVIEWEEYSNKQFKWYNKLFYRYFKGKVIGKEGETITYYHRLRRFI